ncbi:hypothetical protein [Winogradskyella sp. 3972H.M.0a.05]|uniref:hypothetical protein n=1 Tax=Winogradskyella sp. 3972H.M.0a.05 TaxID=2950277 RepID=UPI003390A2A8
MATIILSCDSNNINSIKVYYRNPGISTPYPSFCVDYLFEEGENIRKKTLHNKKFLKNFDYQIKRLIISNQDLTVDSRVFMLINYKDGNIDTLCIGEFRGIFLNGTVMEDDEEFHKMIIDEIDFYDKEKYNKMYGN